MPTPNGVAFFLRPGTTKPQPFNGIVLASNDEENIPPWNHSLKFGVRRTMLSTQHTRPSENLQEQSQQAVGSGNGKRKLDTHPEEPVKKRLKTCHAEKMHTALELAVEKNSNALSEITNRPVSVHSHTTSGLQCEESLQLEELGCQESLSPIHLKTSATAPSTANTSVSTSASSSSTTSPSYQRKQIEHPIQSSVFTPDLQSLESTETPESFESISPTPGAEGFRYDDHLNFEEEVEVEEAFPDVPWKDITFRPNWQYPSHASPEVFAMRNVQALYARSEILRHIKPARNIDSVQWDLDSDGWETMERTQKKYLPHPNWFFFHPFLNFRHRAVVLTWLSEVAHDHKTSRQTYYLAACLFDLFMSRTQGIRAERLQLIGGACLLIASKAEDYEVLSVWEHIEDPNLEDFWLVERKVLEILQWEVIPPLPIAWLHLYMTNATGAYPKYFPTSDPTGPIPKHGFNKSLMVKFFKLLDAAVQHPASLLFPFSMLAAGIFCDVAQPPEEIFRVCTGFAVEQVKEVLAFLAALRTVIPSEELLQPTDDNPYFVHVHNHFIGERISSLPDAVHC